MSKPVINIDQSLFLESFELFQLYLLPQINKDRIASGFSTCEGQEAIDLYLDLYNEHKKEDE